MLHLIKNEESNLTDRFQVVLLDCAYESIQDSQTQSFFSKFVAAKLGGYIKEYPFGVLPFGNHDIVGTLLLLCEKKEGGGLEPIMVFKSTSMERCELFNLPFELFEYYHREGTEVYKKVTEDILDSAKKRGVNVGYNSSWTIQKRIRDDKELVRLVREISVMMITNYYPSFGIDEVLITGVVRFKVDQLLKSIGFNYLKFNNEILPPINCPFLFGEKTAVMYLTEFSAMAKEIAAKYQALWENRLVMGGLSEVHRVTKKAA